MLDQPDITEHTRLCVQLRITERQILAHVTVYACVMKSRAKETETGGDVSVENTEDSRLSCESNGQENCTHSVENEGREAPNCETVDSIKDTSKQLEEMALHETDNSKVTS